MHLTPVGLEHFLIVSAALFCLGAFGVIMRRNLIVMYMSLELMLNAANLAFLTFSRFGSAFGSEPTAPLAGHVFVVFVLTVAAAEAAVALAMAVLVYRRRETVDLDRINLMRW